MSTYIFESYNFTPALTNYSDCFATIADYRNMQIDNRFSPIMENEKNPLSDNFKFRGLILLLSSTKYFYIYNKKMKLIFATNNSHKLEEVQQLFSSQIEILSLRDVGFLEEIEETGSTLDENAKIKAKAVYSVTGADCFADDTGLEVEALDGRPGVYSARYAGDGHNFEANIEKLLRELNGKENRKARFRTVVCLILSGKEHVFEGIVEGEILLSRKGAGGFGYDAVFQPVGQNISFAQMSPDAKNAISHRGRAMELVKNFLDLQ